MRNSRRQLAFREAGDLTGWRQDSFQGIAKGEMENLEQTTEASQLLGTSFFPEALPRAPRLQLPEPGIGDGVAGPKTSKQDLYELARKIASQKARCRDYRDDVISEAYLAVAEGEATDKRGIENAVRRSLRGEWKQEDRRVHDDRRDEWNDDDGHVPFALENLSGWGVAGAPERAKPDVYAALSALTEKQRIAVILTYLDGWTEEELAERLGIAQKNAHMLLERALRAMKIFLQPGYKNAPENAVGLQGKR